MAITFGDNQYGKAEVRLVHITRDGDRHQIKDLNVSSALRGDFADAHLLGDNAKVVATDTQKNTVYAFAQQYGVGEIEEFGLRLGRHFVDDFEWVTGAKITIEEYGWDRIGVDGAKSYADVRRILIESFAVKHSLALQQTLYYMGEQVLEAHPEVAEIRMSMPNKHHFLVDLSPFGLPNDNQVYYAADRPYGL